MRRIAAFTTLPAALGLSWLSITTFASPASALSCVDPAAVVKDASVVVQGHIYDSIDGRLLVSVDEVWKGRNVPPRMQFSVGTLGWTAWDEGGHVRDGITDPKPWVFAPDAKGEVNACTAWRPDTEELAGLRPATPARPMGDTDLADSPAVVAPPSDDDHPVWPYAGAGAALAVGALGLVGWRLRRAG